MEEVDDETAQRWHQQHVPNSLKMSVDVGQVAAMTAVFDPDAPSYTNAIRSPEKNEWKKAMKEEILAHIKNKSFSVVSTADAKLISSRWVLVKKRGPNGELLRYKGRLVARGFLQQEGVHYNETFAPTISHTAARLIFVIAVHKNWNMKQMDVNTAFLCADLPDDELIYMTPPTGFEELYKEMGHSYPKGSVLKLRSCIYGLRQAAHRWANEMAKALTSFGLRQGQFDACIFTHTNSGGEVDLIVAVYVDDLNLTGTQRMIDEVAAKLNKRFKMKDLGFPSAWTGIEVTKKPNGVVHLHQTGYSQRMLERFGFDACKPQPSPTNILRLDTTTIPTEKEKQEMLQIPFREAVGSLAWLANNCRQDIKFAWHQVARVQANPTLAAWKAVARIFRYIKGTIDYGMTLTTAKMKKNQHLEVILHTDSDWAGDSTRQTTSSSTISVGGVIIHHSVKLLKSIALSSCEGELMAASETGKEAMKIKNLIEDIGLKTLFKTPFTMYCDNDSARIAIQRPSQSKRTRHIETRHFWLRNKIEEGVFKLLRIPTEENIADIGTKPLAAPRFIKLRDQLVQPMTTKKKFYGMMAYRSSTIRIPTKENIADTRTKSLTAPRFVTLRDQLATSRTSQMALHSYKTKNSIKKSDNEPKSRTQRRSKVQKPKTPNRPSQSSREEEKEDAQVSFMAMM